jgi:hypothetical protein
MTTHMISTESNKTAETAEMKSDLDNHMSPSLAETATNKQVNDSRGRSRSRNSKLTTIT